MTSIQANSEWVRRVRTCWISYPPIETVYFIHPDWVEVWERAISDRERPEDPEVPEDMWR